MITISFITFKEPVSFTQTAQHDIEFYYTPTELSAERKSLGTNAYGTRN